MKAFGGYHPLALFVYFITVLVSVMFIWNPVLQVIALISGCLFCMMLLNRRQVLADIIFYIPLFLLIAVTNPLFSHNGMTPLFFMNGNPVTLEAIWYGVSIAVMILAVLIWCKSYQSIMTSDKFLYLFGRIIPKTALVLSMAIRFVPMFKRQMHKVEKAQKAMGLYSSKSYVDKCAGKLRVMSAMITWSLENAMETSTAMKARGYGLKGRTNFSLFRFHAYDRILLIISIFLCGVLLVGVSRGSLDYTFYPKMSEINRSVGSIIGYIAYTILEFCPFVIEVKENLKWKFYISRI